MIRLDGLKEPQSFTRDGVELIVKLNLYASEYLTKSATDKKRYLSLCSSS